MEFDETLAAFSQRKQENIILAQLQDYDWGNHLTEYCNRGGSPDDLCVDDPVFFFERSDRILVHIHIEFIECVTTSCHNVNLDFRKAADLTVSIERETGLHDVIVDAADDESDFYPDDYQ